MELGLFLIFVGIIVAIAFSGLLGLILVVAGIFFLAAPYARR